MVASPKEKHFNLSVKFDEDKGAKSEIKQKKFVDRKDGRKVQGMRC